MTRSADEILADIAAIGRELGQARARQTAIMQRRLWLHLEARAAGITLVKIAEAGGITNEAVVKELRKAKERGDYGIPPSRVRKAMAPAAERPNIFPAASRSGQKIIKRRSTPSPV